VKSAKDSAGLSLIYTRAQNGAARRHSAGAGSRCSRSDYPGETGRVSVPLDARSFAWFDEKSSSWHADAGTFTIHVSHSSAEPQLEGKVTLAQPIQPPVEAAKR